MAQLARIGSWTDAPDKSTLEISVSGTTDENMVSAHAFVIRDDGVEQTIPDSNLQPGPARLLLESPHTYSVLVDLNFVTAAKASVDARVVSAGGRVFAQDGAPPAAFHTDIQGTQGQIVGVTFFVSTKARRSR